MLLRQNSWFCCSLVPLTCKSKWNVSFYIPVPWINSRSGSNGLAENAQNRSISKVRVWPWIKHPSANSPLDSCGLVWAEATRRPREGKILLSTGGLPLFSVVMTLPAFFFFHTQYLRAVAGAAWDYSHRFAALQIIERAHVSGSPARWHALGSVACRRSIFFLRFWALEGDVSRRLPPKSCSCSKVVHADSTNPEPGWHHSWILKNALTSDWCQSSGTKRIKLCLLDIKPQSFLFTQWHLQFVKAPGLSTTPCPTISFCFLFLENERVPFFITSTFSPFERRTSGSAIHRSVWGNRGLMVVGYR